MSVVDVVVGRQPVFDRDLVVVGYELLFRSVEGKNAANTAVGGDLMTSSVLYSSVSIGIERLVGDKTVFCNADRGVLVGAHPIVLPPEKTIIEVNEQFGADPEVLIGCRRLYDDGFLIAVDDYTGRPGCEGLLALASMVKIDLHLVPEHELARLIVDCKHAGVLLVAERVETREQFQYCSALGFDYFQGYLLSRPRVVPGHALAVFNRDRLSAAAKRLDHGGGIAEVEQIVRTEPVLALRLLQLAGLQGDNGIRRGVRTLREALVRVGLGRIEDWMNLIISTDGAEASEEEIVTTLTRARMCELLAETIDPNLGEVAYTAGLLSCFDVLLDTVIEGVLMALPLDPELQHGALQENTALGRLVHDVVDYQKGRTERAVRSRIETKMLHAASSAALTWALDYVQGGRGAIAV